MNDRSLLKEVEIDIQIIWFRLYLVILHGEIRVIFALYYNSCLSDIF